MPSSSTHALVGGLIGAVLAIGVCLRAEGNFQDTGWQKLLPPPGRRSPLERKKDDVKKELVDPTPEARAALGNGSAINGTHTLNIGDKTVTLVAFEDRVKMVRERKNRARKRKAS